MVLSTPHLTIVDKFIYYNNIYYKYLFFKNQIFTTPNINVFTCIHFFFTLFINKKAYHCVQGMECLCIKIYLLYIYIYSFFFRFTYTYSLINLLYLINFYIQIK